MKKVNLFHKNNLALGYITSFLAGMFIFTLSKIIPIIIDIVSSNGIPAYIVARLSYAWYIYVFKMIAFGFLGCIVFLCAICLLKNKKE